MTYSSKHEPHVMSDGENHTGPQQNLHRLPISVWDIIAPAYPVLSPDRTVAFVRNQDAEPIGHRNDSDQDTSRPTAFDWIGW